MMQHTLTSPINKPVHDGATCYINDSSRKRKLSFPATFNCIESSRMITNKKRKKVLRSFEDKLTGMDHDFSIDLDLPDNSVSCSNNDDVFDWMENMLSTGNSKTSSAIPATMFPTENKNMKTSTDSNPGYSCEEINIDSFLTLNESDSCYEEMISLLAEGDNDDNNEENVFKAIQESFVSDRFLEHHSFSSASSRPSADTSLALKRSPSFNSRRPRSSRIGIRQGLDQLVKANRLTAKTRHMLLSCKLSLSKNTSQ